MKCIFTYQCFTRMQVLKKAKIDAWIEKCFLVIEVGWNPNDPVALRVMDVIQIDNQFK